MIDFYLQFNQRLIVFFCQVSYSFPWTKAHQVYHKRLKCQLIFINVEKITRRYICMQTCFPYMKSQEGRGYLTVNYTGTQSFTITLSYSLGLKIQGVFISFIGSGLGQQCLINLNNRRGNFVIIIGNLHPFISIVLSFEIIVKILYIEVAPSETVSSYNQFRIVIIVLSI